MRTGLILIIALAAMAVTATAGPVTLEAPDVKAAGARAVRVAGKVYLDANRNGKFDPRDKPLAGVRVTDGLTFATTKADGTYGIAVRPHVMLPVPGTQYVTLCWPSGKWPTTKHWHRVKDIADKARCDFGLRDDKQSIPFTYLHVTDSHDWRASRYDHQHELMNTVLKEAKFIFHTGDMGFGGATAKEMARSGHYLTSNQAKCVMPTFTAIGNHDTDARPCEEYNFCGGFVKFIGPLRFSYDYAGIRFVLVDIIADSPAWVDRTAEWLARDLASVRPGTRIIMAYHYPIPGRSAKFKKVLRDHKVELIHAGHNHAYREWRNAWAAPMVTAFARSSGNANVMRVDEKGTHVAFFCDGCARGSHNYRHSRRCPVIWRTHFLEGQLRALTTKTHKVADQALAGLGESLAVSTPYLYASAELAPGSARRVGLRIDTKAAPLVVSYAGDHLVVDGVALPFRVPPKAKTLLLYVFAHKNQLVVYANDCFFMNKPVKFDAARSVRAFAAGGKATLKTMTVQEIRPDPGNRSATYFCTCDHGRLTRHPE